MTASEVKILIIVGVKINKTIEHPVVMNSELFIPYQEINLIFSISFAP